MDKKEDEKLFGHLLAYNRYFIFALILCAIFNFTGLIDSLAIRSWLVLVLWIAAFANIFAAQVRMMKKYFLPKYKYTGVFSVYQYFSMLCFYFFLYMFIPFGFDYNDKTIEMIRYFKTLIYS